MLSCFSRAFFVGCLCIVLLALMSPVYCAEDSLTHGKQKGQTYAQRDGLSSKIKVPLSLNGFIFFSPQKWAFWLNGVCMTASNHDDAYMRSQGLRLVRVSEKGVWCVPLPLPLRNHPSKLPLTKALPEGAFLLKPSLRRTKQLNTRRQRFEERKPPQVKGVRKASGRKKALSLGF